jgi:hypothetical protein
MTVFSVPRVDIGSLSLGAELGRGGQGRVVAVSGFRISGEWPAVLKIYSPEVVPKIDAGVLEKLVGLPRQLPPDDGRWLLENTAWPAVIAENQGVVCGFLMRTVPDPFYFSFQTQSQGARQQLAETAFLLNPDSYVASAGLAVSDHDRLGLLGSVAAALSRLHALGAAAGDFSPKNTLFHLQPAPSCFFLDCDAVQLHGESVFKQIETPDWEVPEGEAKATTATDSYKFGLFAIRLFARDQSARDPAALAALSAELGRLAKLSQDPDPAQRPAPTEWASALTSAQQSASTTPSAPQPATASPRRFSVPVPAITATTDPAVSTPVTPAPPRRARRALTATALVALLIIGLAIAGIHALSHSATPGSTTSGAPAADTGQGNNGTSTGTGSTPTASSEAEQVNSLLNKSAVSRGALQSAVNDIGSCSNLSAAVTAIAQVADQRNSELTSASALQTGALPDGADLRAALISALHDSLRADRDFLRWGRQQLNAGCSDPAPVTSAYKAGFDESKQAGTAKEQFLQLWNPIAIQQGLPTRSDNFI